MLPRNDKPKFTNSERSELRAESKDPARHSFAARYAAPVNYHGRKDGGREILRHGSRSLRQAQGFGSPPAQDDFHACERSSAGRRGQFGVQLCTSGVAVEFEWDPGKAAGNLRKHGVRFAEAVTVFEDDAMLAMPEDDPEEDRFVATGTGSLGRVLVVVYTVRGDRVRIISARKATRREQSHYERKHR